MPLEEAGLSLLQNPELLMILNTLCRNSNARAMILHRKSVIINAVCFDEPGIHDVKFEHFKNRVYRFKCLNTPDADRFIIFTLYSGAALIPLHILP